jgi:hypothetical protein
MLPCAMPPIGCDGCRTVKDETKARPGRFIFPSRVLDSEHYARAVIDDWHERMANAPEGSRKRDVECCGAAV